MSKSEAQQFNDIRRTIFCTFHKGRESQDKAFEYLEGYKNRKILSHQSYIGLKAELNFYKKNKKQFNLMVAADVGDHTDFSGCFDGKEYRFDVTTNADYKKLADYEPLQRYGDKYKIAILNPEGDILDLIDINYPFCSECGEGRLIDIAVLLPLATNVKGEYSGPYEQEMIEVCNVCNYFKEHQRIQTTGLSDFSTVREYACEFQPNFNLEELILQHSQNVLPYLNKMFNRLPMALGGSEYKITNPKDGDGYHCIKIYWRKKLSLLDGFVLDEYYVFID
jgi:hypothetical protein